MSRESLKWLNRNVLIGYRDARGTAWHYSASEQGDEPNHYPGPVPIADVRRRLFSWTAEARALSFHRPDAETGERSIPVTSKIAIVRSDDDTVLGIRGKDYQIHQFDDVLLKSVEHLLDDDLNIGSAGLLGKGRIAWVQIEAPENMTASGGLEFRPHLLAASSHDGTIATTYKCVSTVVVCDNTLALALRERNRGRYRVRHTPGSRIRLHDARGALGIVFQMAEDFKAEVDELISVRVSDDQWSRFLEAHLPIAEDELESNARRQLQRREIHRALWDSDERVAPWRNTALGVLQAVNTYRHHIRPVRGGTVRFERNKLEAITGSGARQDRAAMATLMGIVR